MNRRPYLIALSLVVLALTAYASLVPLGSTKLENRGLDDDLPDPLADRRLDCRGENFAATASLWRLPYGMVGAISGNRPISSPGGPFESGDVVGPDDAPRQRFELAAVDDRRIFVAVEYGGVGVGTGVWVFERKGFFHWVGSSRPAFGTGGALTSLPQLLALTCKS